MSDFIRIPNSIIDLSSIREIVPDHSGVVVHWKNGETKVLSGLDAVALLDALEHRYAVMTASMSRLWGEDEEEIVNRAASRTA